MPFHVQIKNTKTEEIRDWELPHAHPEHAEDPAHPNYHNRPHIDSLAQAKKKATIWAMQTNEEENTTDWEPVLPPPYYQDPRFAAHPAGTIPPIDVPY